MTNLIQKFFEKLTKKQILVLAGMVPLGLFIGMTLRISLSKMGTDFEKYNIEDFSAVDSSRIDTLFVKRGEVFYIDTLIDYSEFSKEDISFRSFNNISSIGFLSVRNKKMSKYKLLRKGISSKEIFEKNNETKTYSIVEDFFDKDFKLDKLESRKYWTNSDLLYDSFNINSVPKSSMPYETYTRNTDLGNKVLDNEQSEVKKYLEKILRYKNSLKD